jgi:hypothetical protein
MKLYSYDSEYREHGVGVDVNVTILLETLQFVVFHSVLEPPHEGNRVQDGGLRQKCWRSYL